MARFITLVLALLISTITYGQSCSQSRSSCSQSKSRTTKSTSETRNSTYQRQSSYQGRTYNRSNCSRSYSRSSCDNRRKTMRYVYISRDHEDEQPRINRFAAIAGLNAQYTWARSLDEGNSTKRLTGEEGPTPGTPVSLQGDAMLGYRFRLGKNSTHKHIVGLWGTWGFRSAGATEQLLVQQEIDAELANGWHDFREVEAGILIGSRLRLSTGIGQQRYQDETLGKVQTDYYTSTAGYLIPISNTFSWNTGVTVLWGRDFTQPALRPSTGLMMTLSK